MTRSIAFAVSKLRALAQPQAHYAALLCALLAVSPALAGSGTVSGTPTATQAEAEAGTNNTKKLTPLRAAQQTTARLATQGEAQAGTDNTKILTPLRAKELVQTYANLPAGLTIGGNWCESAAHLVTAGTTIPDDDTAPTSSEGDEIITCAYTAQLANSKLNINFRGSYQQTVDGTVCSLYIDAATAPTFSQGTISGSNFSMGLASLTYRITAPSDAAHTYKIRCGRLGTASALSFNGESTGRKLGGAAKTLLWIDEVKQ